MPKKTDSSGE